LLQRLKVEKRLVLHYHVMAPALKRAALDHAAQLAGRETHALRDDVA
jgi:hypothetical protein